MRLLSMKNRTPIQKLLMLSALSSGGSVVEDTASGNPVTFLTDLAKPLKSLVANFLPIQSGTGDPSPENIRPITGWTGVDVWHFPQNLLSINRTTSQSSNGIDFTPIKDASNKTIAVNVKGKNTGNNTFFNLNYVNGSTVSIPAGTYTVYGVKTGIRFQAFCIQDGVEKSLLPNGESTFTVPSDATASWLRIKVDSTDDIDVNIYPVLLNSTDEYETIPVTWSTHGTIYGGYVDLVTGEVWGEYIGVSAKWGDIKTGSPHGTTGNMAGYIVVDSPILTSGNGANASNSFCNVGAYKWDTSGYEPAHFYPGTTSGGTVYRFQVYLHSSTDDETVVQCVGKLVSPVLITTLTPQQINAIKGNNTVWSDGNGDCEVTFLKKG